MKKKIIFIFLIFIVGLTLNACSSSDDSSSSVDPVTSEAISDKIAEKPSHKDEYGCVFADKYEWCEESNQCIKKGEVCKVDLNAPKPARSYNLIEFAFMKQEKLIPGEFKIGIQKLTLAHFRGIIRWPDGTPDTQLLASKENNDWMIAYYGESGQYTCESVESFSFPSEMIADCQL